MTRGTVRQMVLGDPVLLLPVNVSLSHKTFIILCYFTAIDCGNPPSPDPNGSVESTGTILRNTANYSCNDGYVLEGSMTIYCQNDGTWSDDAPKCIRMYFHIIIYNKQF